MAEDLGSSRTLAACSSTTMSGKDRRSVSPSERESKRLRISSSPLRTFQACAGRGFPITGATMAFSEAVARDWEKSLDASNTAAWFDNLISHLANPEVVKLEGLPQLADFFLPLDSAQRRALVSSDSGLSDYLQKLAQNYRTSKADLFHYRASDLRCVDERLLTWTVYYEIPSTPMDLASLPISGTCITCLSCKGCDLTANCASQSTMNVVVCSTSATN